MNTLKIIKTGEIISYDEFKQTHSYSNFPDEPQQEKLENFGVIVYSHQANLVRKQRNEKLSLTDWTQLPDAPVNASSWVLYRQSLRDITAQTNFPWEINWPTEP